MVYNLRLATPNDADRIEYLAYGFHDESPYSHLPVDKYKVRALISTFLYPVAQGDPKVCILLEEDNNVVGVIAGHCTEILFGKQQIASELMWYVLPRYRGGLGAMRLRKAFEYWAEHVAKADIIHMASLNNEHADKLKRHYEKKGYKLFEMTYLKETNQWPQ